MDRRRIWYEYELVASLKEDKQGMLNGYLRTSKERNIKSRILDLFYYSYFAQIFRGTQ